MSPGPEVAVVVGAYNRREFLPSALRSLEAQTLERGRFEVVVTKNFEDRAIDRRLSEGGATVLFDDEPRIGRWLRRAVNASRAPLVTFLDDDDEFAPGRLERLLEVWRSHPDVGFYHNRVEVIDQAGHPVDRSSWRPLEADPAFDRLGAVYLPAAGREDYLRLVTETTHATFNTSSMAVRRELLDGDLGDAFERTQLEDLYLCLAGALAPYGVFLDDRRLTRFRFYRGNVTHSTRWLHHAAESQADMARVARARGRVDWARWLDGRAVHFERMYRGRTLLERIEAAAPRTEVARLTGGYLRHLGAHPEECRVTLDTWAAGIYGAGYVATPSLVRRFARARNAARSPTR